MYSSSESLSSRMSLATSQQILDVMIELGDKGTKGF
jgi:hypothetical protein